MTAEQHLRHHPDRHVDADLDLANHGQLDRVEQQDLRRIWWRFHRLGIQLPAERGLIVLDGGQR